MKLAISSTNKQLLFVGFFLLFTKLIALIKEVYLAQTFGIGALLDAYFIALNSSMFIAAVFLAVLPSVLVPYFVKLSNVFEKKFLIGNLSLASTFVGLINTLLLIYFSKEISKIYQYQPGTNDFALVNEFIQTFSLLPLIILLIGIFSSYLLSVRNNVNSIIEIIPNLIIIVSIFLFSTSFPVQSLAIGTVFGFFLHILILILIVFYLYNLKPLFGLNKSSIKNMKFIVRGGFILFFGQFFMSLIGPIDNYFAISFGEGFVAAYNYAIKLVGIASSLISVLVIRVLLPKFSELERDNKKLELRNLALSYASIFFVVVFFASLLAYPFIPFFIDLIFVGGELTNEKLKLLTQLVHAAILQLPFFSFSLIIVQCYLVKNWIFYVSLFAISNVTVKFISNSILSNMIGISGLMYSWAIMYFWSGLCLLIFFMFRELRHDK